MDEFTEIDFNAGRVERIHAFLDPTASLQGTDLYITFMDTLVNFRHFARIFKFDFDAALEESLEHFDAEVEADGAE